MENQVKTLQLTGTRIENDSITLSVDKYKLMLGKALGIELSPKGSKTPFQALRSKMYQMQSAMNVDGIDENFALNSTLTELQMVLEYYELMEDVFMKASKEAKDREFVFGKKAS